MSDAPRHHWPITLPPGLLLGMLAVLVLITSVAEARIRLITLPVRERVEIQLDNPHATLIEEERVVPLVKGLNQVDFSWAGTQIDPGTIVFRILGPATDDPLEAQVISVSYPPGENALVWQVSSSASGSARVRISYLLGGLNRSFNYRAVASADEKALSLARYVRIENSANEAFADSNLFVGVGDVFRRALTLNATMELLIDRSDKVPILKTYTVDAVAHGYLDRAQDKLNVLMHYVIHNDKAHGLGGEPLPAGKVRIFQQDSQGTTAFLGEDWGAFTPVDDRMQLYLGLAQDVSVKRRIVNRRQERIVGNLTRQLVTLRYEVENFKHEPVTLRLVENMVALQREAQAAGQRAPQWTLIAPGGLRENLVVDETDLNNATFAVDLPAATTDEPGRITLELTVSFDNNF